MRGNNPVAEIVHTSHRVILGDCRRLSMIADESIHLAVTSPPYPMIAMWDTLFARLSPDAGASLEKNDGKKAFELMHRELDLAWSEVGRVMVPGGYVCVNIGDATRKVGGVFSLYPNHSRVETRFFDMGFDVLPRIIWQKTTNAPNKYLGSGMLPAGAYVTLGHEYILVFRKRGNRGFGESDRERRRASALFWEERNEWYSDIWREKGAMQAMAERANPVKPAEAPGRERSAAFPLRIAARLVAMYSLIGDIVLDPFLGTGTTAQAALALARNSIGCEISRSLCDRSLSRLASGRETLAGFASDRIRDHKKFCAAHMEQEKTMGYCNEWYGFPVKTRQETRLVVPGLAALENTGENSLRAEHEVPAGSMKGWMG